MTSQSSKFANGDGNRTEQGRLSPSRDSTVDRLATSRREAARLDPDKSAG